jgi:hypothetical protein
MNGGDCSLSWRKDGYTGVPLTLGEAVANCGLPHTQQLIAELNGELDGVDTQPEGIAISHAAPGARACLRQGKDGRGSTS